MNPMARIRTVLQALALVIAIGILLAAPFPLPSRLGAVDFRPYWSSTYLLARGEDFSNSSSMDEVERNLTDWREPYTMQAWFAPTGNLVLLPLTYVSFSRATYLWLLTNIAIVSLASILIWRNIVSYKWVPLVAAFSFSMTLLSLFYGQVNTLVMVGLALFLTLSRSNRHYAAGASLALTTVKPHLLILTLPLLLADIIRRRQLRVLAGFVGALAGSAIFLFAINPSWPASFTRLVISGMSVHRETPTLSGLLVIAGDRTWGKWLWVAALAFASGLWWRHGKQWDRRSLVDISIIAGLIIAPIGWSYDQVILLFPVLRLLQWGVEGSLTRKGARALVLIMLTANAITFYQRISNPNDVWFLWVPCLVGALYFFAWKLKLTRAQPIKSGPLYPPPPAFAA